MWVQVHHFRPPTFCRGFLKRVLILWSLSIKNWFLDLAHDQKNLIMIESDHKNSTLFLSPRQKVGGGKWWAQTQKTFYAAQNLKIIFKSYAFLQNSLRDFWIFINLHVLNFWKMLFRSLKKSVWWIFKNKKSEMYTFFVIPGRSSWNMTFFPYPTCMLVNWPRK